MIGISKDMDISLSKGTFTLERSNKPGEVYYIRTPGTILLYPHRRITIDTDIRVTLPYGYKGYLRSIPRSDKNVLIDEIRIDDTGNESILVTMCCYDIKECFRKGDIIAELVIRPSYTPENDKDMTKVNRIEIRKAPKSGRQYLILYAKSKGTECDESFTLGDYGYPVKVPRDIVESLELTDIVHTMKEIEYFSKNTGTQNKLLNNNDQHTTSVYKLEIRRALSGKQYLVLCTKDGYTIVDDAGHLEKLSTDIVESLTLVESLYTTLFYEREF